jgi:chromosome transmission fidelity protein 4
VLQALCVGTGWFAVATSSRLVRLFSVGGIQKDIFSIPGPIVSMAAHSNQLFVAYHSGMGKK